MTTTAVRSSAVLVPLLYALLAVVGLLYLPGLHGEFIMDDFATFQPIWDTIRGAISWREVVFSGETGPLGRPIAILSLLADYYRGDGTAFYFKSTNLAIHLACGALNFWISGRLFGCQQATAGAKWWLALLVTAMWLLSPLFVSTVLYVVQRMALLATFFCLVGILAYVLGRERIATRFTTGAVLILVCFLIATPAAVLSKENGALLPLLALVVELFWFGFKGVTRVRMFLVGVFAVFLVVPALIGLLKLASDPDWLLAPYAGRDFSLTERVLTQGRILWDYIGQLLIPQGARMGLIHDDYLASTGLLTPPTTLVAWLLIAICLWGALRWRRVPTVRMLGFGLVFYLAGHLVESTILALELYFEHRNYLSSIGLYLGLVGAAGTLFSKMERPSRFVPLVSLIPAFFAFATHQRVHAWQSLESIVLTSEQTHPTSPRLLSGLATIYALQGNLSQALSYIDRMESLTGGPSAGYVLRRISTHCVTGRAIDENAIREFQGVSTFKIDVHTVAMLSEVADWFEVDGCRVMDLQRLAGQLRAWTKQIPVVGNDSRLWLTHFHMGRLLFLAGQVSPALNQLMEADQISPGRLEAGLVMVKYQLLTGKTDAARELLEELKQRRVRPPQYQIEMIKAFESWLAERARKPVVPTGTARP